MALEMLEAVGLERQRLAVPRVVDEEPVDDPDRRRVELDVVKLARERKPRLPPRLALEDALGEVLDRRRNATVDCVVRDEAAPDRLRVPREGSERQPAAAVLLDPREESGNLLGVSLIEVRDG